MRSPKAFHIKYRSDSYLRLSITKNMYMYQCAYNTIYIQGSIQIPLDLLKTDGMRKQRQWMEAENRGECIYKGNNLRMQPRPPPPHK